MPLAPHAELQDQVLGVLVGPQDGQRDADLGVERALRGHGRPEGVEHLLDEVLGAGLAAGAGDPDDRAGEQLGANPVRQAPQGQHRVVHHDAGCFDLAGGQHDDTALAHRSRGECMAVDTLAGDGHEHRPRTCIP